MKRTISGVVVFALFLSVLSFVITPSAFAATTYSFTTAAATGRLGPTQAQINTAYSGTSLAGAVTINTRGIQEWIVPSSGMYRIVTAGAAGGKGNAGSTNSGKGVVQTIEVSLSAGTSLKIVVGQVGIVGTYVSGGGGGSFVFTSLTDTYPISAAGGGGAGGYSSSSYPTGIDASTTRPEMAERYLRVPPAMVAEVLDGQGMVQRPTIRVAELRQ